MLTPREFEVYMLIVTKAMSERAIARKLGISFHTVRTLTKRIRGKMNMANSVELLVQYHRKEIRNDSYD